MCVSVCLSVCLYVCVCISLIVCVDVCVCFYRSVCCVSVCTLLHIHVYTVEEQGKLSFGGGCYPSQGQKRLHQLQLPLAMEIE